MRKQFDLKYYLEHPETKVVLRDGRNARILCTDLMSEDYPIAAEFIYSAGGEYEIETYTRDGKVVKNSSNEYSQDLFFELPDSIKKRVPLTYEDLLERVRDGKTMWVKNSETCSYISYFDQCGNICFGDVSYSTEAMMKNVERFADDSPCWKEVTDERPY